MTFLRVRSAGRGGGTPPVARVRAGTARVQDPHAHHYHAEFDDAERRLIGYYDWLRAPLQASDEQVLGGEP
jgi:hypothetical protein